MSDFESKTLTKTTQPVRSEIHGCRDDGRALSSHRSFFSRSAPVPFLPLRLLSGLSTRSLPQTLLSWGGSSGVRAKSGLGSNPCTAHPSPHSTHRREEKQEKSLIITASLPQLDPIYSFYKFSIWPRRSAAP